MVLYIKDKKFIDVESTGKESNEILITSIVKHHLLFLLLGDRESSYESFLEKLKIVNGAEKECRYGLFDFEYTHRCQGTQKVKSNSQLFSWTLEIALMLFSAG